MQVTISASELKTQISSSDELMLIDVRSPTEYAAEHIPGSDNIPLTELTDAFSDLDLAAPVVFICQSGVRSLKAVTFAISIGYTNSKSLEGGINTWKQNE